MFSRARYYKHTYQNLRKGRPLLTNGKGVYIIESEYVFLLKFFNPKERYQARHTVLYHLSEQHQCCSYHSSTKTPHFIWCFAYDEKKMISNYKYDLKKKLTYKYDLHIEKNSFYSTYSQYS